MYSNQIVNQVFNNKRTVSDVYRKHRDAVLFVLVALCGISLIISGIFGEINNNTTKNNSIFDLQDLSKYTVVFETTYGQLEMDLEAAVACILPTTITPDNSVETIKAQAILLRTELMYYYAHYGDTQYYIHLKKDPFIKKFVLFTEQKKMWGEKYYENMSVYKHAVMETAGQYIKSTSISDSEEIAPVEWFYMMKDELWEADRMAKSGSKYDEILDYFFTNIAIDKFE